MSVLPGPWRYNLPPTWYASINNGASAFSVMADTREGAYVAAHDRLSEEIVGPIDADDPFAMDTAYSVLQAESMKLRIYSGPEWTEHVLAEAQETIRRRWPNWTPQGAA